jgi:hypothetical protein
MKPKKTKKLKRIGSGQPNYPYEKPVFKYQDNRQKAVNSLILNALANNDIVYEDALKLYVRSSLRATGQSGCLLDADIDAITDLQLNHINNLGLTKEVRMQCPESYKNIVSGSGVPMNISERYGWSLKSKFRTGIVYYLGLTASLTGHLLIVGNI